MKNLIPIEVRYVAQGNRKYRVVRFAIYPLAIVQAMGFNKYDPLFFDYVEPGYVDWNLSSAGYEYYCQNL